MGGPFGPCGTDAVVITGILHSDAILASAAAWERSFGIGISPMVWKSPLWWSISSIAASFGSMTGFWPSKLAGLAIVATVYLLRLQAIACGTHARCVRPAPSAPKAAFRRQRRSRRSALYEVEHCLPDLTGRYS